MGFTENATNINIMNAIRSAVTNTTYTDRIPVATQQNINQIQAMILEDTNLFNSFNSALVNRIGFEYLTRKDMFENPLREFKKGMLPYGATVEEIYVGLIKSSKFDPDNSYAEVFKRYLGDVRTVFHSLNRQDKYKITISEDELSTAFLSSTGLQRLITAKINSLFESDQLDEYLLMKQLIAHAYTKGQLTPVYVDEVVDEASARNLVKQIRIKSVDATFLKSNYTPAKVPSRCLQKNQIVLVTPSVTGEVDVEVLARAFNMNKTDFMGHVVVIDDFGSPETDLSDIQAVVVDREFFQVWDSKLKNADIYNPDGLYWNNYLHHWQILSSSIFAVSMVFMKKPTVTAVVTSPATSGTYKAGEYLKITATTTGDKSNAVTWILSGNNDDNTFIDGCGNLFLGKNESGSLTVKATSVATPAQSKSLTLTKAG